MKPIKKRWVSGLNQQILDVDKLPYKELFSSEHKGLQNIKIILISLRHLVFLCICLCYHDKLI